MLASGIKCHPSEIFISVSVLFLLPLVKGVTGIVTSPISPEIHLLITMSLNHHNLTSFTSGCLKLWYNSCNTITIHPTPKIFAVPAMLRILSQYANDWYVSSRSMASIHFQISSQPNAWEACTVFVSCHATLHCIHRCPYCYVRIAGQYVHFLALQFKQLLHAR